MPFFSICIPQYNRTSFLMQACRVLKEQTFQDFELCISDDCSTDGREEELKRFLEELGLAFVYLRQTRNRRYDGNLRSALSLATGDYCLLMGNDDQLAKPTTLEGLHQALLMHPGTGVAVANYAEYAGGRLYRRVRRDRIAAGGPDLAVRCFRNFSFVSGVVLRRDRVQAHSTGQWDGSEMYQMYLGCRILAEGYDLLELEQVAVLKGISIPGESVDSYAASTRCKPCPVVERRLPLVEMGRLVHQSVLPHAGKRGNVLGAKIFVQILLFTYPFWIFEYRRVQSWKYALGICLGMRPRNLLRGLPFGLPYAVFLRSLYLAVTCAGLLIPRSIFDSFRPRLHDLAKSVFQRA